MSDIHPTRQLAAKTTAQRQADLRLRRAEEGRNQALFWLTAEEKARVKAFLAGEPVEDATRIAAQRDELAAKLDTTLKANRDLRTELTRLHDDWREAVHELQEVRRQLAKAEQALSAKPAKTFKVPELPDRRAQILSAMSTEEQWREGGRQEMGVHKIEQQAALAKKFATEIRQAHSRLTGLIGIVSGEKLLEQSKATNMFGSYNRFKSPLISPAEKALLKEACVVMGRLERDVELAGRDVSNLHKLRAAEDKARLHAANAALDAALFKHLDRRGEVLFVAAVESASSWGPWRDLVQWAEGKDAPAWESAVELFRKALLEAKGAAAMRVAAEMKTSGDGPARRVNEIVEKYHHPDTRKKHGALADQVTAFLVSEQLSGTK